MCIYIHIEKDILKKKEKKKTFGMRERIEREQGANKRDPAK